MALARGDSFPDFEIPDLDGRVWSCADLANNQSVIFFFATWRRCRDQLPLWQQTWEAHQRGFRMIAVAQDALGVDRVQALRDETGVTFPILIDRTSVLAGALRFKVVPTGFFVDPELIIQYRHLDDFDIGEPRVQWNLSRFLNDEPTQSPDDEVPMGPGALEIFARGVRLYSDGGDAQEVVKLWRQALELDPDNFLIRSQIWAAEHPERFYPVVDQEWQSLQLLKEGYDKPLP